MDDSPVDMNEELYEPLRTQPPLTPPPIPNASTPIRRHPAMPGMSPNGMPPPYGMPPYVMVPYGPPGFGPPPWMIQAPPRPRIWTGFTAFGIYLALTFMVGVTIVVIEIMRTGAAVISTDLLLTLLAFNVFVAGAVAVAGAWLSPQPLLDRLQLRVGSMGVFSTLVGILTTCAIGLAFTAVFGLFAQIPEVRQAMENANFLVGLRDAGTLRLVLAFVIISLGAGIGEELLFRGYMQSRFVGRMGFYGALFTTAALFGLAHMNLVQTPFAFVMGLFVGHLSYRTGSILPAILGHTANNAMAVALSTFDHLPTSLVGNLYLLAGGLVVTVVGWLVMIRITPGLPAPVAVPLDPPAPAGMV